MTPDTVVVVPVLGRPEQIAPLVESLRSTSEAPIVFVCSRSDRAALRECKRSKERVLTASWEPGRGDFARKTNLAFRETTEAWLFCGATDLRFHRGWEEQALLAGERSGAGVVGTQDLGNPLVKRGAHATHPLVRRSYIETEGGTTDGYDIYSEAYSHQYVDLELVEVAKMRGQWAFSKRAIVEHLHPNWKKGVWDDTYEKAFADAREDRALYQRRMRQFQTRQARTRRRAAL